MSRFVRFVLAIVLPLVGVFLAIGLREQFWLNLLATRLGSISGTVHATWTVGGSVPC